MDFLIDALGGVDFAMLYSAVLRYVFPVLALIVLGRCAKSLLTFKREAEIWAWLILPTGDRLPVTHWESLIGRGKNCDISVDYPTVSRTHAVLTRYDDGSWSIRDIGSKGALRSRASPSPSAPLNTVRSFPWAAWTFIFCP